MIDFLETPVRNTAAFQEAEAKILANEGPVQIAGTVESLKAYMMYRAGQDNPRLLVTYDEASARMLLDDIRMFEPKAAYFPPKDFLFYQADAKSDIIVKERLTTLKGLLLGETKTVVTTAGAMMNTLVPSEMLLSAVVRVKCGDTLEIADFTEKLLSLGYERVAEVTGGSEFSVRGGIVDVFDRTAEQPYRIEFFGDEVDTIRPFSPETQISFGTVEDISLFPATEFILTKEILEKGRKALTRDYEHNLKQFREDEKWEEAAALQHTVGEITDTLGKMDLTGVFERYTPYFYENPAFLEDYMPKNTVMLVEEPNRVRESAVFSETEFTESCKTRLLKGLTLPKNGLLIRSSKQMLSALDTGRTLVLTGLDAKVSTPKAKSVFRLEAQAAVSYAGNYEGLISDLLRYQRQGFSIAFVIPSKTRGERIAAELLEKGVHAWYGDVENVHSDWGNLIRDGKNISIQAGTVLVTSGTLKRGFILPMQKFALFTEGDIFGGKKEKKRKKNAQTENGIKSFGELTVGDYVVHETYGIGVYRGVEKIRNEGVERDYIHIEYGGGGSLHIPITMLGTVQKYASHDAKPPKINRLDSPEWGRTKSRVKAAVQEVASELVALYAARSEAKGYSYAPDTLWQKEFEEMFPYTETDDQLAAIDDVKRDMESGKIMDRLLCGDVGFGKTEVAIRAAFKAVQEGKQVAYLVPTTILAKQHYNTFRERMKEYPVTVEMLSRFTSAERAKKIVKDLGTGMTDIVIGTHKILSKNVSFKDLGLLIIDEEQRFGVNHKEKIKQMRKNVDVLTLTATPIPRTLHMAMVGIRDMSILTEAPEDRKSVQTYVMEYEEELVREAILRETARGGQVYYVYNRAADIANVAGRLQELLPETGIAYVHGKMKEEEIDKTMLAFIERDIDVLVSTTIIETGIDIPNVNTIIIHDAERYGLAQLYQLRGRVGRSSRQAFAFIMYRKDKNLSEEAQKRLEAIRQFTELGSGIRIATEDLEIRGAGAVLGNAQSGHMALVGYDLYYKLLRAAVQKARGDVTDEEAQAGIETAMDIQANAYIPDGYVSSGKIKLELYKRISCLTSEAECDDLKDELIDRFGAYPKPVENLIEVASLKLLAQSLYISEVKADGEKLRFTFAPDARVKAENIPELILKMNGRMRFVQGEAPSLVYSEPEEIRDKNVTVLMLLRRILTSIKELLI